MPKVDMMSKKSAMSNRDFKTTNFAFNQSIGVSRQNSDAGNEMIDSLTYEPPFESKLDIKMPTQPAEELKEQIRLDTDVGQSTSFFIKAIENE